MTTDPLDPDAPLLHLLSIKHNPLVAEMNHDQLMELVKKLRTLATSPPTLSARLKSDGDKENPKSKVSIAAKRRALLDNL
jgi:hypothetical protein